uniref:Interleukin-6 n=1 Tax=Anolis carolinensis TaxID=28377 RepID=R4GCE6_ANOCA|nr:PREDICTED: interleukin-6 [Anolis carolinensis]|eukprot:XP_008110907.2 PREDICTED: interleukin-6 [Anolis carolinensis]
MRALLSACFCFWATTVLLLGVDSFPVGDSSGEDELGDEPQTSSQEYSPQRACTGLFWGLHSTASGWKKELCKEQNACKGSMEMLVQNNLHLPKITPEDGCSYTGFQKETCLRRLSSGLYAYQAYLEYIDDAFSKTVQMSGSLWPRTRQLADILKSMMNNPDIVTMLPPVTQDMVSIKLREQKAWNITVIKFLILQDFISFLEKTARAFCRS